MNILLAWPPVSHLNSVNLPLQPKNFKSKKKQKSRSFLIYNTNYSLKFGHIGLIATRSLILTSSHLSKLKFFLKRAARKGDKTKRKMWFSAFPHLPLTKKAANVRMGKGKGKLKTWFTRIRGGNMLVEYKNLRYGRAIYFFEQTGYKSGSHVSIIRPLSVYFNFPFRADKKVFFNSFWN